MKIVLIDVVIRQGRKAISGIFALFIICSLASCVTLTPAGPPPLIKKTGPAPKAVLLPWNARDAEVAGFAYDQLTACLQERNVFQFVPREEAERVIKEGGYDLTKIFGLNKEEYKQIAAKLGVDYVLSGTMNVMKSLSFSGWRKDIASDLRINRASDGSKLDSWLSNTSMTFTDTDTALNAKKMAESVTNNLCSRVMEGSY